jgi:tetratricopeptide (TPR) repeat protein
MSERGAARKNFLSGAEARFQVHSRDQQPGRGGADWTRSTRIAADYFKQALAMDESVASTHLNLAEAWLGMGEMDHAMTEYARALELDADHFEQYRGWHYRPAWRRRSSARALRSTIAKSYIKRGNIDGALVSLGKARDLHY